MIFESSVTYSTILLYKLLRCIRTEVYIGNGIEMKLLILIKSRFILYSL